MASVEPHTWGIWEGRDFKQIQVWRSPEGMVIIENPNRLGQIAFTPAQWAKVTEHVMVKEEKCEVCGEREGVAAWGWDASPLCPKHRDQADKRLAAAERDANA